MKGLLILALMVIMIAAVGSFAFAHHADGGSNVIKEKVIYYDSVLNDYFDADGTVIGGQNDGMSIDYLRNNPPIITEDGSLE